MSGLLRKWEKFRFQLLKTWPEEFIFMDIFEWKLSSEGDPGSKPRGVRTRHNPLFFKLNPNPVGSDFYRRHTFQQHQQ